MSVHIIYIILSGFHPESLLEEGMALSFTLSLGVVLQT